MRQPDFEGPYDLRAVRRGGREWGGKGMEEGGLTVEVTCRYMTIIYAQYTFLLVFLMVGSLAE